MSRNRMKSLQHEVRFSVFFQDFRNGSAIQYLCNRVRGTTSDHQNDRLYCKKTTFDQKTGENGVYRFRRVIVVIEPSY